MWLRSDMDEKDQMTPEETREKTPWQARKEGWYDKIPLTLKQLDILVAVCLIALVAVAVVIALDAMNIVNPFGY